MREIKQLNVDAFKHLIAIPPRHVLLIAIFYCLHYDLLLKSNLFCKVGFSRGQDSQPNLYVTPW